jgi:hypothetical protein
MACPLEPAAFDQAWSAGHTVPLEEAVTEALAMANEVTAEVRT